MFSEEQIKLLRKGTSISDKQPWAGGDRLSIANFYEMLIAEVCRDCDLLNISEIGHFEMGISSYVDCFFFRDSEPFRTEGILEHWGLNILFSGQSPYYVVGEGKISPLSHDMLTGFDQIDQIEQECVQEIMEPVCNALNLKGLYRLFQEDFSQVLSDKVEVATFFSSKPFHHFDLLYRQ